MGNKPERANAGRRIASLALPVPLLALELDLSLQPDGPDLAGSAAQDVRSPVLPVGCCPALFRKGFPTGVAGTQEALRLDEQVGVGFPWPVRSLPTAVSKEARSKAGDLGDGSPSSIGHPSIRLLARPELLPQIVRHQRGHEGLARLRVGEKGHHGRCNIRGLSG